MEATIVVHNWKILFRSKKVCLSKRL